ncbi:MAG TPA: cytochrome c biogenesis protein ResB [Burkholderiaceae bacterium]|nr:cytochrome c biogenesis protein ResB [Burkholderiaceae bacterium]
MRFAVSLLMFICVASLIGTVLQQNDTANAYLDRFGPFWYELFDVFAIWNVYNSWWFLLIMGFLVVSTTICLIRNTPKFIRDARSFREYVRGSSLRAFPNRVQGQANASVGQTREQVQKLLRSMGYRYKVRDDGDEFLIAAKKGGANRLGYIFTHAAIVVICIGGLLDSELPVRVQMWVNDKSPIVENMLISEVPESGRLPMANPSFKAHLLIPEGGQSSNALVSAGDGVLVQPLPFNIRLNRFLVDYYSTGMPSSFKSEVLVTDPATGESFEQTIEVNEPLHYKGVTVYQSSLDDGGSRIRLTGYPLGGSRSNEFTVDGVVGQGTELVVDGDERRRVEVQFTELRVINVENLGDNAEPQPKPLVEHVASVTGSAIGADNEHLKNVGPSIHYRIVGSDGQATEYTNYMLPIELDGIPVFLAGMRRSPAEPFRYVRFPVDEDHSVREFMDLRAALENPQLVRRAAMQFAERNASERVQQPLLEKAARGALESFVRSGFSGIIEAVPEAEQETVLAFAVPMIQLTLAELRDLMRAETGRAPLQHFGPEGQQAAEWLQVALLALANLPDYPAPVFMTLSGFDQVQASVFQVTRSPGKFTVYLGSLFLVIGIFAMFYVRDRRVWVWLRPGEQGTDVTAAMTSMRRNIDFNQEFDRFKQAFSRLIT